MKEKDKRVKLIAEVLYGIRVLKLYAWEESFSNVITKIRQRELSLLKKIGYVNALNSLGWQCAKFFVSSFCKRISQYFRLSTLYLQLFNIESNNIENIVKILSMLRYSQ